MKQSINSKRFVSAKYMRLFSLTILTLFFVTVASNAQTNFTGSWKLNEEKSEMGDNGGRRFGGNFEAKQEANLLTVDRTMTNRDGETMKMSSKYTLDGKESINESRGGQSKSKAKWSEDKKTLTILTVSSYNGNERTSTEVWTLKDKATLVIASTRQGRDGAEVKTTMYYDKN